MARLRLVVSVSVLACGLALVPGSGRAGALSAGSAIHPLVGDWQLLNEATAPPSEAACNAIGRRCFVPAAMANSYDYASLLAAGNEGQG
jgi:hypothetical protein